jgi:hypothetical protein
MKLPTSKKPSPGETPETAAGRIRPRPRGPQILILPRTRVLERLFVLPTCRKEEVEQLLRYRIPAETPFLLQQVDWQGEIVGQTEDGSYLARVVLVERQRFQSYLDACGLEDAVEGVLLEDDLLQLAGGERPEGESKPEIRLHQVQDRLLAFVVREGRVVISDATSQQDGTPSVQAPRNMAAELCRRYREAVPGNSGSGSSGEIDLPLRASPDVAERLEADRLSGMISGIVLPPPALPPPFGAGRADAGAAHALPVAPLAPGGWLISLRALDDRRLAELIRSRARTGLLPEGRRARITGRRRCASLLRAAVAGLALTILFSLAAKVAAHHWTTQRRGVDQIRELLHADLQEVQAAQELIKRVEAGPGLGPPVLKAWDRVAALVPPGAALTGLSIQDDGVLVIHGLAEQRSDITSLMEAFRADSTGFFAEVLLEGLESKGTESVFHVTAKLASPAAGAKP